MNAVFDTNILIDALNGVSKADTEYSRALLVTRNTKDFKPEWDGIHVPYSV